MGKKAAGGIVVCIGYVKVHSAPYTYNHGGQAEQEDPKCAPLPWSCHPSIRGLAGSGSITSRDLHLLSAPDQAVGPAMGMEPAAVSSEGVLHEGDN
jgi:hypothetical protein